MSGLRRALIISCVLGGAILAVGRTVRAEEPKIPWSEVVNTDRELPKIFRDADALDIRKAKEVARLDAYRKLRARIYGVQIDADTDVQDLALEDDRLRARIDGGTLAGMKELGWRYYPDGRCEVAVQVTLREVIEVVATTYKRYRSADRKRTIESLTKNVSRYNKDTKVIETGNGALAGSVGYRMILARRAAELDAYRRIAAKVAGLHIDDDTLVCDFVLARDVIKAKLARFLTGVRFTRVRYENGKICYVDAAITIRQIVSFLKRTQRRYLTDGKWKAEKFQSEQLKKLDTVVKATGEAPITDRKPATPASKGFLSVEQEIVTTVIQKRVVDRKVGVLD